MTCAFGGYSCLDPSAEAQACAEHGYPLDPWWGTANTFVCPLGQEPGRGRLLMAYGDVTALPLNGLSNLVFSDGLRNITLKNLVFVGGLAVTPDSRGNPSATYWIEVADRRILCRKVPIDKAYNVRGSNGGAYLTATQNAGVAWTWATMFADIWTAVGKLGSAPALPFVPDGTPEGYSFYGSYAYDALGHVLDRLGCALRYDPTADSFGVVRLGVADPVNTAALLTRDNADDLLWDSNPLDAGRVRVPSKARVLFPRQRQLADATGASPWYTVDVTDPTPGGPLPGTEANTYQLIYDDLPAIYDGTGALTNTSVLASRAAERAADYFRRVRVGRLHRAFSGGYADRGLLPGPRVKATRWSDRGSRLITDVVWLPGAIGPTGLSVSPTVWDYSLWSGVEVGETWARPYLVNRIMPGTNVTITPGGVGDNEILVIGATASGGTSAAFSGAKVFLSPGSQNVANNTTIQVTWTTSASGYDTDSYFASGTPSRLTVPTGKAGKFRVNFVIAWFLFSGSWPGGTLQGKLRKNGATVLGGDQINPPAGTTGVGSCTFTQQYSEIYQLADGDYFEVQAYQTNPGASTLAVTPNFVCYFAIERVGS